ncbi:hypothetical protein Leryth_007996 [Lithospermum erythrorhizon]|nr:hypothetical protein Leryth_007996 [Lithospermum erythrorhizon]
MNLFKSTVNISRKIQSRHHNQRLTSLLPKQYSTEAEPHNQNPPPGVCYGRLLGITKYTTRSDVCNLLDGCNLNLDDIKVDYNRIFLPVSMLIRFPSRDAYEVGLKATRRERLHRLDMTNHSAWGTLNAYAGRSILLEEVPRSATADDVDRFLSGCQYDPSTFRYNFSRGDYLKL